MIMTALRSRNAAKLCQEGRLNEALQIVDLLVQQHNQASVDIFACLLRGCIRARALTEGKQLHGLLIKSGFDWNVFLGNSLVELYANCYHLVDAFQVFSKMPKRNVFSWTAIISAYAKHGLSEEAVKQFYKMLNSCELPDDFTYVTVLKSCANMGALEQGRQVHAHVVRSGTSTNIFVASTLIDMYGKCGSVEDACLVFNTMCKRVVVSWNAIIGAYARQGHSKKAIALFEQMQTEGTMPDNVTVVSILRACSVLASLEQGKGVHAHILTSGVQIDVFVESTLVDMYAKCGGLEDARQVFDKMCMRDAVSWNAMITGYVELGFGKEAFVLFDQMQKEGVGHTRVTFLSILKACASVVALDWGKQVHDYILKSGFEINAFLQNMIVDMYAKCGSMEDARLEFDNLYKRDLVSWNVMIGGYAMQGLGDEALTLFGQMHEEGMKPDEVTFVSALSACSHGGLVDKAYELFDSMGQVHHLIPSVEHYSCIVDILGRNGCLEEAHDFIRRMPIEPNFQMLMSLLRACKSHGNVELGKQTFEHCVTLKPKYASAHVQLSNMYAAASRWDEVVKLRKHM